MQAQKMGDVTETYFPCSFVRFYQPLLAKAESFPAAKVKELSNFLSIGVLLSYTVEAWPNG